MRISNLQLELASQKKDTDQAILHQRNEMEAKMQLFNHTLEKEKSNRHQLEREYTKLSLDYQTLTNQYNDLSARYTNMSLAYDVQLRRYSLLEGQLTNLAQETGQMNQSLLLFVTTNHADILELRQKQSKPFNVNFLSENAVEFNSYNRSFAKLFLTSMSEQLHVGHIRMAPTKNKDEHNRDRQNKQATP